MKKSKRNTSGESFAGSEKYESVKHPRHYNMHPNGIECIEVIEHMTFNVGSAIKYLWRAGLKPTADEIEDLDKAIEYIEFEKKRLLKQKEKANGIPQ